MQIENTLVTGDPMNPKPSDLICQALYSAEHEKRYINGFEGWFDKVTETGVYIMTRTVTRSFIDEGRAVSVKQSVKLSNEHRIHEREASSPATVEAVDELAAALKSVDLKVCPTCGTNGPEQYMMGVDTFCHDAFHAANTVSTVTPVELTDFIDPDDAAHFDEIWEQLSVTGSCDGLGGAEYHRVRAEWFDRGAELFIRHRANILPDHPLFDIEPDGTHEQIVGMNSAHSFTEGI